MKIHLTEGQLRKIVAESARRVLREDQRRAEIDAAWAEFDEKHRKNLEDLDNSMDWFDFLDDQKKCEEIQDTWDDHEGIKR